MVADVAGGFDVWITVDGATRSSARLRDIS